MPRPAGYDYVIVGAGPAGCVLANRLSANPSTRVLLLEEGTTSPGLPARLLARFSPWLRRELRWEYLTVPQEGLSHRRIYLPQGRALGGGSAVNAMTYVRGHPDDYAHWQASGNDGWGPDAVLAAFTRLEHNHAIADEFHGRGGPLHVADQVAPHPLTGRFVEAGREVGLPANPDFNGAAQEGVGIYQVTQLHGRRWSAADAFLHPVRRRPNLTVLTGACAARVLVSGGRATGIEFARAGRTSAVAVAAEVIVSGGAINSPKLLLLSGIGPADELRQLGIRVVHDLPGVGRNLHDHVNVQVIARCHRPVTYDHWERPLLLVAHGLKLLLFNSGIATSILCEGGAFLRSAPGVRSPDVQLHFLPLIWLDYGRARVEGHGVTVEAAFLRPESRGTLRLASPDPQAAPLIDPRYCTASRDVEVLVAALRRCRDVLRARAFGDLIAGELYPGPARVSDPDLAAYVRDTAVSAYHPVGTCRMGVDAEAVVDPRLRVRGLSGLRVVDSSIMPRIVSGSTQAPAGMIGEMGAAMILAPRAPAERP